jgi:hypothetical protein
MTTSQQFLVRAKSLGAEWRARFATVAFVGEIEVDEALVEELRDLFRYGQVWSQRTQDQDVRVAFAVLVVNLAYYAPSDQTKKSLSRWVCDRLGCEFSSRTWEDQIGDPVTRVLAEHFDVELRSGSYRYVTPINQQAGINAAAVKTFGATLYSLLRTFGSSFSKAEYDEALGDSAISSAPFVEFLQTPAGYAFSKEIARNVANVLDGVYDWDALKRRSAFRRHLLDRLQQVLEGVPKRKAVPTLPKPKLAVDRTERQLVVLFGDLTTSKCYRWPTGRPVDSHHYELVEGELGRTLLGSARTPSGVETSWTLDTWSPAVSPWALFRLDDGVFLAHTGPVRPGRYLLAVPSEVDLADVVDEDFGEMYLPGHEDASFRLVDCTLPPGFSIPEIELGVDETCAAAPWLRFVCERRAVPGTTNVFRGELPQIEVVNWTESFSDEFAVVLCTADDRTPIRPELLRRGPRCHVGVKGGVSGSLSIEPIGRVPAGFVEAPLAFVVVPGDFEVSIEDGLRGDHEPVRIEIACSSQVQVRWRQKQVRDDGGAYVVPGDLDYVEGAVAVGGARFDIALRIPRLSIHGSAFPEGILWADALQQDRPFEIAVSQTEVGTNPKLVLAESSEARPMPVLSLQTIPKTARRKLSVADVRGALAKFDGTAGRFALQLAGGRIVPSRILFMDAGAVERWVVGDADELALADEILPGSTREALVALRTLVQRPGKTTTIPVESLPARLRPLAERIVSCALTFDHEFEPEASAAADSRVGATLRWYVQARRAADLGDDGAADAAQLLVEAPQDLSEVPFDRWRRAVSDSIESLQRVADVERAVREWAELCRQQRWAEARASGLGARSGGDSLTMGAERYYWALAIASEGNPVPVRRLGAALSDFLAAARTATSESVRSTALVLTALCYTHARHPNAESEIATLHERVSVRWGRAVSELQLHLGVPTVGGAANGLGVADISPHEYDSVIFGPLGRQLEGVPGARSTARSK